MKLVKLDDDVWVNPEHVTSVERTADGAALSLVNRGIYRVNVDVYEVLDRLDPPVLGVGPTPPPVVKFDPEWM